MTKWKWQGLPTEKAALAATERTFQPTLFGAMVVDDYGTPGSGRFYWFESPEEMVAYLGEVEPLAIDDEAVEQAEGIREALTGVPPLSDDALDRVNEAAAGLFQVAWWGRGDSLATSDDEFAVDFRRQFRDSEGDEEPAISADEMDEWTEFVREYVT